MQHNKQYPMRYLFAILTLSLIFRKGDEKDLMWLDWFLTHTFLLNPLPGSEEFTTLEAVTETVKGKPGWVRFTQDVFGLEITPLGTAWGGARNLVGHKDLYSPLSAEIRESGVMGVMGEQFGDLLNLLRKTHDYAMFHNPPLEDEGKEAWHYAPYTVECVAAFEYQFHPFAEASDTPEEPPVSGEYRFTLMGEWDDTVPPALK